ncbi:UNVERIFIED_CONTAM: 2-methylbutanal oxime monooxygenase [Sesamum latifolium]|uniref:2-methylbutanal oxime monooxygenase n=1 Tax=Sesamum latifolium TaxID=2727402 RepID=A0AAW2UYW5_9LAMI
MLPLLVLLALPIILFFYFQKHKSKHARSLHPPGPPGLPFIGNFHQFDTQYPHIYLHSLSKLYGPIMSMKLGSRPVVVISSANVVKEIMKSHDLAFSGRPMHVAMHRLSYNGLGMAFISYSDLWKEMRRVLNLHFLSPKQVHLFCPIRKDKVSRINQISREASLSRATNLSQMIDTVRVMAEFCVEDYFPLLGWIDKISGTRKKLEKTFRKLDSFYEELIEEHLDKNRPKAMEGDILDILLGLMRDGLCSIPLTMDHVKAILMVI